MEHHHSIYNITWFLLVEATFLETVVCICHCCIFCLASQAKPTLEVCASMGLCKTMEKRGVKHMVMLQFLASRCCNMMKAWFSWAWVGLIGRKSVNLSELLTSFNIHWLFIWFHVCFVHGNGAFEWRCPGDSRVQNGLGSETGLPNTTHMGFAPKFGLALKHLK